MLSKIFRCFSYLRSVIMGISQGVFSADDTSDVNTYALMTYDDAVKSGNIRNRTNIDYNEAIHKDRMGSTFYTYCIRKFKSKPTKTSIARGFEERSIPFIVTTNAEITTQTVAGLPLQITLAAGHVDYIEEKNTLKLDIASDEANDYTNCVWVYSKDSSTQITVYAIDKTKYIGLSSGVPIPTATTVNITGSIFEQFAETVEPITALPTRVENVTQITRTGYKLSGTAETERLYGETERSRLRSIAERRQAYKRENTQLFNGAKVEVSSFDSTDGQHRGYMQGLEWTLTNYGQVTSYSAWDYAEFLDWLASIFNPLMLDGTQTKRMVFTNQAGRRKLTDLKHSHGWEENLSQVPKFGTVGVQELHTDSGVIDLYVHPLVNALKSSMSVPYFMAFHPAYIEYKPKTDRTQRLRVGIQNPSADGQMDEFLVEETAIVYLPELGGIFKSA